MPEDNTKTPQKPAMPAALTGLTKRQQVEKANKNIFIWVAVAAVIVSLSAVFLQFLIREALFNGKVIDRQQATSKTLEQNKKNFEGLKSNIDALLADDSLAGLRVDPKDSSLQVILDALPTSGDTTSFSNSLYNKVLSRQGVTVSGVSVGADGASVAPVGVTSAEPQAMTFGASISGSPDQIRATLMDIEKVIRPINIRQLSVSVGSGTLEVNFQGETYFLPRSSVSLGKDTVKP